MSDSTAGRRTARSAFYVLIWRDHGCSSRVPMLWLASRAVRRAPRPRRALAGLDARQLPHDARAPVRAALAGELAHHLRDGTAVTVTAFAALAAYALSRVRIPGRDALLYGLLLLSIGRHRDRGDGADLRDDVPARPDRLPARRRLVITGGLLPAAIFILKDFIDAMPRSYEESARVFGASTDADPAARRAAGGPARAWPRSWSGRSCNVVGQLPGAVPAAARRRQAARPRC